MSGAAEKRPLPTVAVVGLGLLGGSLARALKAAAPEIRIVASSLDGAALAAAEGEGVVDRGVGSAEAAAASGGIVVYAAPLEATLELMAAHRERWSPDAVITDVVSVKGPVLERMRELGEGSRYVGSHPMAGSEETGFGASRADLFRDALVHLVRGDAGGEVAARIEGLWERAGARIEWVDADEHDRRMALASHLPQLASNALATVLGRAGLEVPELGPGGRDGTRLAASPPDLWRGLLAALASADAEALRALADELEALAEHLDEDRLDTVTEYMERTRRWRRGNGWS